MADEPDPNDLAILQAMMGSNMQDRRNPYAVVPPGLNSGALGGEAAMVKYPSNREPMEAQTGVQEIEDLVTRMDMTGDNTRTVSPEEPVSDDIKRAMMLALRPDLRKLQRPDANWMRGQRFYRSLENDE